MLSHNLIRSTERSRPVGGPMDWVELIKASRLFASGQPSQEALRRTISATYCAMFHALATSNADIVVGQRTSSNRSDWLPTYRSLRHFRAENPLYGWPRLLSAPVQNSDTVIAGIKRQREDADYSPDASFARNHVFAWIDRDDWAIVDFKSATSQGRTMLLLQLLPDNADPERLFP